MTALNSDISKNKINTVNLFKDYHWFDTNIYKNVQNSVDEFFQKDIKLRLIEISKDESILMYGDEYFVNQIPVTKNAVIKVKISSELVSSILDMTLGGSDTPFKLNNLTDIEAMLLKSFTLFVYKNIQEYLNKIELNKKELETSKEYKLTFYAQCNSIHSGKIIITIPDYMIPEIEDKIIKPRYSINDFKNTEVDVKLSAGSAKIALNEIKTIEEGDIILLDNSNINQMSILWDNNKADFNIAPNPSLIINIDNTGGKEMEETANTKSQNMWDSILVDIVAEFDNVKLTLGELKQISEGLVIDLGSVYENKIKLRVENQVVATGELVILNDRYGVRVENITKAGASDTEQNRAAKKQKIPEKQNASAASAPNKANSAQPKEGDENFNYSDFEVEDESI